MNKYSDVEFRSQSTLRQLPPLMSPKRITSIIRENLSAERLPKININAKQDFNTISALSVLENNKAKVLADMEMHLSLKSTGKKNKDDYVLSDFSKIIKDLDLITKKRHVVDEKILKEGELVYGNLKEGDCIFYKILIKDKISPIKVHIKKNSGMLNYYISKKKNKPNEEQYDFCFNTDTFEISERLL